ncbi:DinB family protein [Fibrella forsythiae]|uniref:DinB family protein n=1 Tax=Fibrella forsythiae TaxID=2817061 RepID=A0ABS3JN28_9BACT|nr:DinB family protein [Fibrella forsythiae]MBO0951415.1 DinB family protein [Fibrella forsythiae]
MTIQDIMARQWSVNQLTIMGPISKMTDESARFRLTPETASAAFIALHTGEAIHRFAKMIFNYDSSLEAQAMGGVTDDGRMLDLSVVMQVLNSGFALIAEQIKQTSDEQWTEIVATPFGEIPRMGVLQFLMHHNSYHCGQISQAIKKGKLHA